jgi:hypothetical protein
VIVVRGEHPNILASTPFVDVRCRLSELEGDVRGIAGAEKRAVRAADEKRGMSLRVAGQRHKQKAPV